MYDSRLRLANQIYDEVKRHFPGIGVQDRNPAQREAERESEPWSPSYPLRCRKQWSQEPSGLGKGDYQQE